jgi:(1->4)-alpha-D-glucan 1-alpha-D-glucosylmutase
MNAARDGGAGTAPAIPTATYRLQLNRDFTFDQAAAIVPYLRELGVSHAYASPYLKARPGSTHGYDIIDHNALNPELGGADAFTHFVAALRHAAMGHILDLVPNHMGVGSDNAWWMDVLENGQASPYAIYFDIDWHPEAEGARGKVLLPVLTNHYGTVLESGAMTLACDEGAGELSVHLDGQRFPVDPGTYPPVLAHRLESLEQALGRDDPVLMDFHQLLTTLRELPPRTATEPERQTERTYASALCKRRLAGLCARSEALCVHVRDAVAAHNGTPGDAGSFDRLHELLEQQAYRLAYWRVAADEINYRRFFDISDLAGLRMEVPAVFEATHALVLRLVSDGRLQGLRIDHPDGLSDPAGYYMRLRDRLAGFASTGNATPPLCYLVVEKILADREALREDWPVHGTTGYDFANEVNGLLVYPGSARYMDRLYARFTGQARDFDEVAYERRKLIVRTQLSSELTVLTDAVHGIAKRDRHTRDFTRNGLRDALTEVVACFPVYRTYVTEESVSEDDGRYVMWAVTEAKRRSPVSDFHIFDFLGELLLLQRGVDDGADLRRDVLRFATRFQQYTAPVMAKGIEDTAFYDYNRLLSLNEVGGDPNRFGVSMDEFHRANAARAQRWPHAMLTTSTHDTKRSEDVRARLNVLSEIPVQWRRCVARWRRINRPRKHMVGGREAPSPNDEYHLYQILLGAWPLDPVGIHELTAFRERIDRYMLKAVREAKVHTSWINPNAPYEKAMSRFIERTLGRLDRNAFLESFLPFQRHVAQLGLHNSLAQTLLKLTSPGVPDIYQGNEVPVFELVDPDNREGVDYERRRTLVGDLRRMAADPSGLAGRVRALAACMEDGRAKLYLIWRALALRNAHPELFSTGDYLPLAGGGRQGAHLCAFARRAGGVHVIVAAPRWFARLAGGAQPPVIGAPFWPETWVTLDPAMPGDVYRNLLSAEQVRPRTRDGARVLDAAELFADFPVALLVSDTILVADAN